MCRALNVAVSLAMVWLLSLVGCAPGASPVVIRVVDGATGEPVPARVELLDGNGVAVIPDDALRVFSDCGNVPAHAWLPGVAALQAVWNGHREVPNPYTGTRQFYAAGSVRVRLPAGSYSVRATKGIEYRRASGTIVVEAGQATRIYTGAMLPAGADTVVMIERAREDGAAGTVSFDVAPTRGQHVRGRGQDLGRGETVLCASTPLHAPQIAALASVGHTRVMVHRRPTVYIVSTGDEIVEPEDSQRLARTGSAKWVRLVEVDDDHSLHAQVASGALVRLVRELARAHAGGDEAAPERGDR